jgi:hypothetical protein
LNSPLVSRRNLGLGLLVVMAAGGAYLMFGASDQKRVLNLLRELAAAMSSLPGESELARGRRLRAVLTRSTVPAVRLSVPELGAFEGPEAIARLLELAEGRRVRLTIEQSDVRLRGSRAEATLLTTLIVNLPAEERRQSRTLSVELVREKQEFRVASVAVSAQSSEQPEARP